MQALYPLLGQRNWVLLHCHMSPVLLSVTFPLRGMKFALLQLFMSAVLLYVSAFGCVCVCVRVCQRKITSGAAVLALQWLEHNQEQL
jgi:hypothetical protein